MVEIEELRFVAASQRIPRARVHSLRTPAVGTIANGAKRPPLAFDACSKTPTRHLKLDCKLHRLFFVLAPLALCCQPQHALSEEILVRSGDPNAPVRVLSLSDDGPFPQPFTPADFRAAAHGAVAQLSSVHPWWVTGLPDDSSARWVSTTSNGGNDGHTALYAVSFDLLHDFYGASIHLQYAVDDVLGGDGIHPALFLNEHAILDVPLGGYGGHENYANHGIAPFLSKGQNIMYMYAYNIAIDDVNPAGLLFSARIDTAELPSPLSLSLRSANSPHATNFGQIGASNIFTTSLAAALDEDEGKFVRMKAAGDPRSSDVHINTGQAYHWPTGERSLQGQVAVLKAPVRPAVPLVDGPIGAARGWVPFWLGRSGPDPDDILVRQRDLATTVEGSFQLNADIDDMFLRLTAKGSMDSYTIRQAAANVQTAVAVFGWIKTAGKIASAKAAQKLDTVLAAVQDELISQDISHIIDMFDLDPVDEIVSEYQGEVSMTFQSDTHEQGSSIMVTSGWLENPLAWTARTHRTGDLTLGPFSVSAGEIIPWSADFRTMVETRGYAKVDAQIESYQVEVLSGDEVIGVVHSWEDPIGGASGQSAHATIMADSDGDGIPNAPTEDHDLFNNMFFEERIIEDLTYGQVFLVDQVGSLSPTNGFGMALVEGNSDTAGSSRN